MLYEEVQIALIFRVRKREHIDYESASHRRCFGGILDVLVQA